MIDQTNLANVKRKAIRESSERGWEHLYSLCIFFAESIVHSSCKTTFHFNAGVGKECITVSITSQMTGTGWKLSSNILSARSESNEEHRRSDYSTLFSLHSRHHQHCDSASSACSLKCGRNNFTEQSAELHLQPPINPVSNGGYRVTTWWSLSKVYAWLFWLLRQSHFGQPPIISICPAFAGVQIGRQKRHRTYVETSISYVRRLAPLTITVASLNSIPITKFSANPNVDASCTTSISGTLPIISTKVGSIYTLDRSSTRARAHESQMSAPSQ